MNNVTVEVVVEFSVSGVVFVGFLLVDVEAVHWVATAIGRNVIYCEVGDIVARIGKIFLRFTSPGGSKRGASVTLTNSSNCVGANLSEGPPSKF